MSEESPEMGQESEIPEQEISKEGAVDPVEQQDQPNSESPTDDEPKHPPKGVQKRLNELTREKHDERRRADELAKLVAQQQALLAKAYGGQETQQKPNDGRPDPDDYQQGRYDPDYLEELASWKATKIAEQQYQNFKRQENERIQKRQMEDRQKSFAANEAAFSSTVQDYDETREALLLDPSVANHEGIGQALLDSEIPAQLVYYLGQNLDEARKIAQLNPIQAARYIGKLEAQLSTKPKPTSKAPAPMRPISASSPAVVMNENGSMEDYIKARESQGAFWSRRK